MFGLLTGNVPISHTVNEGILQSVKGGRPPISNFIYLLDINGNDLLDAQDRGLTTKYGRLYKLYGSDQIKLADLNEFLLGVRS